MCAADDVTSPEVSQSSPARRDSTTCDEEIANNLWDMIKTYACFVKEGEAVYEYSEVESIVHSLCQFDKNEGKEALLILPKWESKLQKLSDPQQLSAVCACLKQIFRSCGREVADKVVVTAQGKMSVITIQGRKPVIITQDGEVEATQDEVVVTLQGEVTKNNDGVIVVTTPDGTKEITTQGTQVVIKTPYPNLCGRNIFGDSTTCLEAALGMPNGVWKQLIDVWCDVHSVDQYNPSNVLEKLIDKADNTQQLYNVLQLIDMPYYTSADLNKLDRDAIKRFLEETCSKDAAVRNTALYARLAEALKDDAKWECRVEHIAKIAWEIALEETEYSEGDFNNHTSSIQNIAVAPLFSRPDAKHGEDGRKFEEEVCKELVDVVFAKNCKKWTPAEPLPLGTLVKKIEEKRKIEDNPHFMVITDCNLVADPPNVQDAMTAEQRERLPPLVRNVRTAKLDALVVCFEGDRMHMQVVEMKSMWLTAESNKDAKRAADYQAYLYTVLLRDYVRQGATVASPLVYDKYVHDRTEVKLEHSEQGVSLTTRKRGIWRYEGDVRPLIERELNCTPSSIILAKCNMNNVSQLIKSCVSKHALGVSCVVWDITSKLRKVEKRVSNGLIVTRTGDDSYSLCVVVIGDAEVDVDVLRRDITKRDSITPYSELCVNQAVWLMNRLKENVPSHWGKRIFVFLSKVENEGEIAVCEGTFPEVKVQIKQVPQATLAP